MADKQDTHLLVPTLETFADRICKRRNEMSSILEETAQTAARENAGSEALFVHFVQTASHRARTSDAEAFAKIALGRIVNDNLVNTEFTKKELISLERNAQKTAGREMRKFWENESKNFLTKSAVRNARQKGVFTRAASKMAAELAAVLRSRCNEIMISRQSG